MSALLCSDYHIATMAVYIASLHENNINAQELANKLKRINMQSVDYRYNEKTRFSKCKINDYLQINANDFAALFACWDYQSCENQGSLEYQIVHDWLKAYASTGSRELSNISWSI